MPIMDGFEACRRIRKHPIVKDSIIIVISASVFECHKQQSLEVGCNDFLAKPIRAEELLQVLEKYLQLTWVYEKQTAAETIEQEMEATEIVGPSNKQAEILFDLAMRGDLDSLVKKSELFELEDKKLTPFVNQIRKLAKNFKEEQICDLIEQYI